MADDSDELDEVDERVARATRPIVQDDDVTTRVVTQGQLASYIALLGGLALSQQRTSRALVEGDAEKAKKFIDEAEEQMLDLLDQLRKLVVSPGADE